MGLERSTELVPAAVEQQATPPSTSHNVVAGDQAATSATENAAEVTPVPVTSPLSAMDDDNIEPQWVDAVDRIVDENGNDPRQQEEAAEDLSQKYLKERFGIDVKEAS